MTNTAFYSVLCACIVCHRMRLTRAWGCFWPETSRNSDIRSTIHTFPRRQTDIVSSSRRIVTTHRRVTCMKC